MDNIELSKAEVLRFNRDVNRFSNAVGEKKLAALLRRNVKKFALTEARNILATETDNTGKLEALGLLLTKEKGTKDPSFLIGGGRGRKYPHGHIAHWVELGTSGIVRDGGDRYKSGQRYRSATKGIHFLERAAENTEPVIIKNMTLAIDRAFKRLKK